jgi:hypothetical protein
MFLWIYRFSVVRLRSKCRFIWKARLSLTPVNASNHLGLSRRCRKCGAESESLAHVLNHCRVHSAFWRKRHDGVQALLVEQIAKLNPKAIIKVDEKFPHVKSQSGGDLRPDIIIEFPDEKKVVIVDIKCTIDQLSAWDQSNILTETKYRSIANYFNNAGYSTVVLGNFIISSLGSFSTLNWNILNKLNIARKSAKYLIDKCRRQCIHWSRNIWVTHCGNEKMSY